MNVKSESRGQRWTISKTEENPPQRLEGWSDRLLLETIETGWINEMETKKKKKWKASSYVS